MRIDGWNITEKGGFKEETDTYRRKDENPTK
jgi:hypothetical protein